VSKTVLITGATSGFGKAAATIFAENGNHLILTGRRQDRLTDLQQELTTKHKVNVFTLCFDIRDNDAVLNAIDNLPHREIDILVNNAGLASGLDLVQDGNIDDWEKMIDTNVKGLLYISKAIMPLMIERKKGHIINIGSTAGN